MYLSEQAPRSVHEAMLAQPLAVWHGSRLAPCLLASTMGCVSRPAARRGSKAEAEPMKKVMATSKAKILFIFVEKIVGGD